MPDEVGYLLSLLGAIRKENFGLERMEALMGELGHPELESGIVHIAGTNGKGSTAAMIESVLLEHGQTTGLYTSPHLSRINERYRINGREACPNALAAAIRRVRSANERIVSRLGRSSHPTFFESCTAVALVLFAQSGVRWKIVETGLGGRLDASNVVRPQLAVITRVGRDHERFLGLSIAAVAAEKAGIAKADRPVVIGPQVPEAREALLLGCAKVGAPVIDAGTDWQAAERELVGGRWRFAARGPETQVRVHLGVRGEHQIENALTATAALRCLGIPRSSIAAGIARAEWPGRLELRQGTPPVLLDAAHNPSGARALARFLGREAKGRRLTLIYGSSRDKAIDEVAAWLFPLAERVILTRSRVARAASPEALLLVAGHHHRSAETAPNVAEAMRIARRETPSQGWIVVAGSLFLVGEARELLG